MQKALEPQLFPNYVERLIELYIFLNLTIKTPSGVSLAEVDYRGHGRADWGEQVKDAVEMMEVMVQPEKK